MFQKQELCKLLDNILKNTKIPSKFEILYDIDSYDLEVWESIISYSPK